MNNLKYVKVVDINAMTAPGVSLVDAINDAINLAKDLGCTVSFQFNGIPICVDEWDTLEVAGFRYRRQADLSCMESC